MFAHESTLILSPSENMHTVLYCRLLDIQSSDYNVGLTLPLPSPHRSPSKQRVPSPQRLQQEVDRDLLYGSELIRQSLMATSSPGECRDPRLFVIVSSVLKMVNLPYMCMYVHVCMYVCLSQHKCPVHVILCNSKAPAVCVCMCTCVLYM